jgi:nicotinate-nucleotide adenylyltransferase
MTFGILGGTFDPVHYGHLDVARAAIAALGLNHVLLMPCAVPSHRGTPAASAAHRFAMAALAIGGHPRLRLSDSEMQQTEPAYTPSYTIDTLDRMAANGTDLSQLCVITGADAFADIRTWKHFPALLDRCHFAVVSRPDHPAFDLPQRLPELAARMVRLPADVPARPSILLIDAPTAAVSASGIRRRLAARQAIDDAVPAPVAEYLAKHSLYAADAPKGLA